MGKIFVHPDKLTPDRTFNLNGVRVNEYYIENHNVNNLPLPTKRTYALKGVTIHNTLTLGKDDDAKWYVCSTQNSNMSGVFVNAYVDCNGAWQELPWDSMNWSCSDGVGYAGGNAATIAIEVIMDGVDGTKNMRAMANAERLAAYLLYNNGLTADDLYTHSYWINTKIFNMSGTRDYLNTAKNSRKNCPVYIIPQWDNFKRSVDSHIVRLGGKSIYDTFVPVPAADGVEGSKVQWIYQATSTAAVRPERSKNSKVYGRVTKGDYYCADALYPNLADPLWFRHAGCLAYSMLYDGGYLFKKVGNYSTKRTTCKLNVREKPSTSAPKMATLPEKNIVRVWGDKPIHADGYDWVKIIYEGKIGYVASQYLK